MRGVLLTLALLTATDLSAAETLSAVQGQVLSVAAELPAGEISVEAFDRKWPTRRETQRAVAHVGIDLATAPGSYPLRWRVVRPDGSFWQREESIEVVAGDFPESHITVQREMADFDKEILVRIKQEQQALLAACSSPAPGHSLWAAGVMPVAGEISTRFGARRFVNGIASSAHNGIDIAAPIGTPVLAPLDGMVMLRSEMYLTGITLVLGHGDGLCTIYAHLASAQVEVGAAIVAGQKIGEVGMSGRSTGPHLHWGARFNEARIAPQWLLPAAGSDAAAATTSSPEGL